ncbi:MAG: cytochrome c family protein [Rhodospirillaceae bacterium]
MHFEWYHKFSFGLLIAAWVAFGANFLGHELVHANVPEKPAYAAASKDGGAAKEDKQEAAPVDVVTLLAKADAAKGEKAFGKCKACHTAEKGGKDKVGPNLWDVVGRAKGGHGGFGYSDAIKAKGGDWSFADLGHFLENPKGFVPGTKMGFAGVKKPAELADLLVYLRSLSDSPKPLP